AISRKHTLPACTHWRAFRTGNCMVRLSQHRRFHERDAPILHEKIRGQSGNGIMLLHERNELRYYQFDIFSKDVINAVFTRQGGVSPEPWHSLNLSISVGDEPERVAANRVRAFETLGRDPASIHDVWLVHGTDIIYADNPRP